MPAWKGIVSSSSLDDEKGLAILGSKGMSPFEVELAVAAAAVAVVSVYWERVLTWAIELPEECLAEIVTNPSKAISTIYFSEFILIY